MDRGRRYLPPKRPRRLTWINLPRSRFDHISHRDGAPKSPNPSVADRGSPGFPAGASFPLHFFSKTTMDDPFHDIDDWTSENRRYPSICVVPKLPFYGVPQYLSPTVRILICINSSTPLALILAPISPEGRRGIISRTWYVIADGGRARIVQRRAGQQGFDTRQQLVSADIHHRTHELGAERPGRTRESAVSARHAVEPREDLHRADKQRFAREVAAALNRASALDEFDRLVLVAPAHALGDLRQALDASTQRKITTQLQKDLTKVPDADFAKHFSDLDRG